MSVWILLPHDPCPIHHSVPSPTTLLPPSQGDYTTFWTSTPASCARTAARLGPTPLSMVSSTRRSPPARPPLTSRTPPRIPGRPLVRQTHINARRRTPNSAPPFSSDQARFKNLSVLCLQSLLILTQTPFKFVLMTHKLPKHTFAFFHRWSFTVGAS